MSYTSHKILFISLVLLFVMLFASKSYKDSPGKPALEDYAKVLISKCSTNSRPSSCYDLAIPKLMDPPVKLSLEDSFALTRIIQEKDSNYRYCHNLGHKIAIKETKKDPLKWKEIITRCPDGMCDAGCMHGAFAARFQKEYLTSEEIDELKIELQDICKPRISWNPTYSQKAFCYHGLGHLLMYVTSADINKSVEICNLFEFSRQCMDGAFMQIFQQIDEEDRALVADMVPSKKEVFNFCGRFGTYAQTECMIYSWPKFSVEILEPGGLVKHCSYTSELTEIRRCQYKLIGTVTVRLFEKDQNIADKMRLYCASMPKFDNQDKRCFATAAQRMVQYDTSKVGIARQICEKATGDAEDYCFNALSEKSKKVTQAHSAEFNKYCNSLPAPWDETCLDTD